MSEFTREFDITEWGKRAKADNVTYLQHHATAVALLAVAMEPFLHGRLA